MLTCQFVISPEFDTADTITLDEIARNRRRLRMISDNGIEFLLDLPEARLLRHGDGLQLSDGRIIEVKAVPEALYSVTGKDSRHLLALAWQIGNRHLAAQIKGDRLFIRCDPVIREMLEGLGAAVSEIEAPFDPEGGAYGDGGDHHHAQEDQGHHHHE